MERGISSQMLVVWVIMLCLVVTAVEERMGMYVYTTLTNHILTSNLNISYCNIIIVFLTNKLLKKIMYQQESIIRDGLWYQECTTWLCHCGKSRFWGGTVTINVISEINVVAAILYL